MFGFKTTALRCLLALAISLAALTARDVTAAETAASSIAVHFAVDRPTDASMAPFFLAAKDGSFGAERANLVFGWIFAGHQLGAGVAAFGAGLSRTVYLTYLPAFFVAGALCIVAALIALPPARG